MTLEHNPSRIRFAMTLVETLVVITIMSLLVSMLLPAIHAVREASRLSQCQNHLRQLTLGIIQHEAAHGHLPTGGWGYQWLGDPDSGFAEDQPGGWIYNVLPFIEEDSLRHMGEDATDNEKRELLTKVSTTSLAVLKCPTRLQPELTPYTADEPPRNAHAVPLVAKSDYAMNAGDVALRFTQTPKTVDEGHRASFRWPDTRGLTGVAFLRSRIGPQRVEDGLSKTYLVGEKYVDIDRDDIGNDQSMFTGHDFDTLRWTFGDADPKRDGPSGSADGFGSAHRAVFQMAFCDGSVARLSYDIDPIIHRFSGHRHDGRRFD